MSGTTVEPELHRPQIERLFRDIGLTDCRLLVEDSVHEWAVHHKSKIKTNPWTAGIAGIGDGVPVIVLLRRITAEVRSRVTAGMEIGDFAQEVARIAQPLAFLEHLVLHEAAHLVLTEPSEADCDRWAFQKKAGRFQDHS